jgi:hypothetical protein
MCYAGQKPGGLGSARPVSALFPSTAQRQLGRGLCVPASALFCSALRGLGCGFSTPRRAGAGAGAQQRNVTGTAASCSSTAIEISGPEPLEQREGEGQVSQWPRVCKGARRVWSAGLSAWWFFFFFRLISCLRRSAGGAGMRYAARVRVQRVCIVLNRA